MKMKLLMLFLVSTLICFAASQDCRNNRNWKVDWWIMISFPGSVSPGYAYFDSRYASPSLSIYAQQPDNQTSPLGKTFKQINDFNFQTIAWNDQIPEGLASSSKAHSKSVAAYNSSTNTGFIIIHSIPSYPRFIQKVINYTIDESQQIYGQHIICISGDKNFLVKMINKISPIRPQTYAQNYDSFQILSQVLSTGVQAPNYNDLFSYNNYTRNGSQILMIFKNGYKNGSIFQDGINNMLNSSLLSQTWGRPLQDPWCGSSYSTGNILNITMNQNITWKTTQDHSKWLISENSPYSCFGDMNRMDSQWTRGGAFYCIKSSNLNAALKGIIKETSKCATA